MKKIIWPCLFLLCSILSFIALDLYFAPDSCIYYYLSRVFSGEVPFQNWWAVRGFSLPLALFIFTKLFGATRKGILLGLFFVFLIFNYLSVKLINIFVKDSKKKNIAYLLYIFLVIFNPMVMSYSHIVLTEAIIPLLIIVSLIVSYKWVNNESSHSWIRLIIYSVLYSVLSIISWFLKQPYYPIIFFVFFFSWFFSLFKSFNKKRFFIGFIPIIVSLFSLFLSMNVWNMFLTKYNISNPTSSMLNASFIDAMGNYYIISEDNENLSFLSKSDIDKIKKINNKKIDLDYRIYNVFSNNKIVDQQVLYYSSNIGLKDSLKFYIKQIFVHPVIIIKIYYTNYMNCIDLYQYNVIDNTYYPGDKLSNFNGENGGFSDFMFHDGHSYWGTFYINAYSREKFYKDYDFGPLMKQYEHERQVDENVSILEELIYPVFGFLFKTLFFFLPIMIVISLFSFFKNKKDVNFICVVIFISSFFHVLFHAGTGAIIDRYAYAVFPILICGYILFFLTRSGEKTEKEIKINEMILGSNEVNKDNGGKKVMKIKNKILFVIPAYNEAENIEKVLDEIKKDVNYADILVINDCSKDNTEEVLKKNGVNYLNNVYNMKYAMTVQTGIKYAYENDYDYVISMDADGQHIASEAKKMYEFMLKEKCDIVIGSRYMKDMGYKCPTFRRIGTKIFEIMIKIFCKKRIYDPLSGFQCINKKVIKEYAQMGGYPEFPDANLIVEMLYKGYDIKEIPVKMRNRESGESMHGGIIKPIKYMVNIAYTICFIVIQNIGRKK